MTETKTAVLILCTGNSARSQMAEAILRHAAGGRIRVESAGTRPQPEIHPMARLAVKRLAQLDMEGQYPKLLDRFLGERFAYVITVCGHAEENCPVFPGTPERIHWDFSDPAAAQGSEVQRQGVFDETAAQLGRRISAWLADPSVRATLGLAG